MKNEKKENRSNVKGITLIALVVSVIVLLILAGVSISAITGNESAMEKAKQARTENEAGAELDAIKLAVVSAMSKNTTTYGMVELENLKNELKKLDGVSATLGDEAGTFKIVGKKGSYIVYANGQVEEASGLIISTTALKVVEGKTGKLTATVDDELVNENITWTASDGAKLIVNNTEVNSATTKGKITEVTVKATAGKITVTVGSEKPKTCTVSVVEALSSVTVSIDKSTIEVGSTAQLTTTTNTEGAEITYSASPDGKVTINQTTGVVTGVEKENTVTITATAVQGEGADKIEKTGTCTVKVTPAYTIGTADPDYLQYYGQTVSYPSQDTTKTWQFYYRDNKNTYLIASAPTTTTYKPSDYYDKDATNQAKYASSYNVSEAGRNLNPMIQDETQWFTENGKLTWANMRALAWFTDTAETDGIWSNCTRSGAVQGEFALASPSIELLLKSYNAAVKYYNDNKSDNQTTRTACTLTLSVGSFGYKMSGNFIVDQENNGLYNNGTSYWISSPGHSNDATTHRGIYIDGGSNTVAIGVGAVSYRYYAVRPLVCIPNTSFQSSWLPQPQN